MTVIAIISFNKTEGGVIFHLVFLLLTLGASYAFTRDYYTKAYRKEFKDIIITPLIRFIDKSLVYRPKKFVNQKTFEASKIETRSIVGYTGDDFVYGNIDGVNIKFSELSITTQKDNSDDSDLSFWGLFIAAEFPKHFKAHTLVHSKKGRLFEPRLPSKEYKVIKMDSPAFNKEFVVYSTQDIEPRYILSLSLMEKIIEYNKEMSYPTTLSFVDGTVYISNMCGDILEPSVQKSLLDFTIAKSYALSLSFAISVVETLKLDQKLWSKY